MIDNITKHFHVFFLSDNSFYNSPLRDFLGVEFWGAGYCSVSFLGNS